MLLMVGKGTRSRIYNAIYRYTKVNKKYMEGYDKNKKIWYFKYWHLNNLYGWVMSQKLPADDFKWVENLS